MLEPGKYTGRPIGAGVTMNGKQVAVTMVVTKGDHEGATMTWFGALKEGEARRITMETLVKLGFSGNTLRELSDKTLDTASDIGFTVGVDKWTDSQGAQRSTTKIKSIGSGGQVEFMDPLKASTMIPECTGELMQARQKLKKDKPAAGGGW